MSDKVDGVVLVDPASERVIYWTYGDTAERFVNNTNLKAKRILSSNMKRLHHQVIFLVEQEVKSAKEFKIMILEFDAKTVNFELVGEEYHQEELPFQQLPKIL